MIYKVKGIFVSPLLIIIYICTKFHIWTPLSWIIYAFLRNCKLLATRDVNTSGKGHGKMTSQGIIWVWLHHRTATFHKYEVRSYHIISWFELAMACSKTQRLYEGV